MQSRSSAASVSRPANDLRASAQRRAMSSLSPPPNTTNPSITWRLAEGETREAILPSMRAKSLRLRSARSSVVALVIPLLRVWHMAIDFQAAVSASKSRIRSARSNKVALLPVAAKTEKAIICCCGVRSSSSYSPNASSNRAPYARAKAGVHSPESGAMRSARTASK